MQTFTVGDASNSRPEIFETNSDQATPFPTTSTLNDDNGALCCRAASHSHGR